MDTTSRRLKGYIRSVDGTNYESKCSTNNSSLRGRTLIGSFFMIAGGIG